MSCCPSAATLLRHQNLAKLLFPEMAAVAALQKCTEDMLAERGLLLTSENSNIAAWNAMSSTVVRCNQLRVQAMDFEHEQLLRVKDIDSRRVDALEKIDETRKAKAAYILQVGKQLPIEDRKQDWEHDTDAGEHVVEKDEFDAIIARQEVKLADLRGRFLFERMLNSKLKLVMQNFATAAKLKGHEAALWLQESGADKLFKLGEDELRASNNEAFLWMRDKIYAADVDGAREEIENRELWGSHSLGGSTTSWSQTSETISSHGAGQVDASTAKQAGGNTLELQFADDTGYCKYCKRGDMKAEDMVPIICYYCGKYGHLEERCFELHPELLERYRKSRPSPFCIFCQKDGHWRKYCKLFRQQ